MTQQTFPLPIDRTLTPENARQRGYTLVCDVFPAFVRENRELMATLAAEGCVLGDGSAGNPADCPFRRHTNARAERSGSKEKAVSGRDTN